MPLHLSSLFDDTKDITGDLPHADLVNSRVLGEPWFKHYEPAKIDPYIEAVHKVAAQAEELKAAKALCARVRNELEEEGYPTKDVPIGVMVETPAAAVRANDLAKEAAFVSVGTNDLTQYTLAVDRQNAKLDKFYDPYHPALLALMAHIAKAANDNGIWAGICGELGADPKMQEKFIEMGYTELSMAAGRILETRKLVCESEA